MPPSNAMENDKKRLRNQFTKDERTRLLAIMTEYGPLLDDKNISILSRKEIWEIIENKFNENGHSGRTSAQLKKYWQNYKYHSKRTKIIHKEVPKPLSPMTKHMVRMLAKVNPEEWAQYDVAVNSFPTKKSPESSKSSPSTNSSLGKREGPSLVPKISTTPPQRSLKSSDADVSFSASESRVRSENSGIRNAGGKSEISESNVVVSTTDVPGSSVTVSVICPEVNSSKARTIFWKRSVPPEKTGPPLQSSHCNEGDQVADDFGSEAGNSDVCSREMDDMQSGRFMRRESYGVLPGNKLERSGPNRSNKKSVRNHRLPAVDDRLGKSEVAPRQRVPDNQSAAELIGNVIGVVKEIPKATVYLSKDSDSMELSGLLSLTKERSETTKISAGGSILNPFSGGSMISQEIRVRDDTNESQKVDGDYSELNEILKEFSAVKESLKRTGILEDVREMMEMFNKGGNGGDAIEVSSEKVEMQDMMRCMMNRGGDSSTQDFLWLKLWLRLLGSVGQSGRNRSLEILRKFKALISTMSFGNEKNEDDEESSDSDRTESDFQGMEVDEDTNPENGTAKLRVRRVSLMEPAVGGDEIQREIKVETEMEPAGGADVAQDPLNDNTEDDRAMNSMNYLVQAKLQFAKSELDHQFKLQKLETEEKELRVRIAEMTIQETRLRIQALIEERLRAKEIHELRLAQMAAEKVRSEAEHAARIDTSCIATAEGRARISCIERDHERSENLYQMQLRCIGAGSANGNCGVKCKQYQQ